jgi:hypothetical protein
MEEIIKNKISEKEESREVLIDLSKIGPRISNLPDEEILKFRRKAELMNEVLEEMDCKVNPSDMMNVTTAHVPDKYTASEFICDVIDQCNVIFEMKDQENVAVNLDLNDITLVKAISNLSIWHNKKNPYKKKEYREADSN